MVTFMHLAMFETNLRVSSMLPTYSVWFQHQLWWH